MAIRDEIMSLLQEPIVRHIDFCLDGRLPISGEGFALVRDAIRTGRIAIISDPSLPSGVGASYAGEGQSNHIGVQPSLTPHELATSVQMRANVLHECSHALVDLMQAHRTTILTDEAAAYIVQLIYRLGRGQAWLRSWAATHQNTADGRLFHETIRVIDRYRLLSNTADIPSAGYGDLRLAINDHPIYSHHTPTALTTADGIP
ncbi:MAG: hypothetical protein GVY11_08300 [Gammaproteobacteria bacterium]|jgi:hypothetical protein|nr:hypothetical protein [Gammaproteobacteria bacterium]